MPRFEDYYTFSKYNRVKVPADPVHLLHSIYRQASEVLEVLVHVDLPLLNLVLWYTFSAAARARALGSMATHIDVDVRSERRRFVEAIAPARFQRKILRFLDQNGGPTLERADDRKQAKWMQSCADKGFLFAMVFHRCVDGCCCVAAVLRLLLC